MFPLPHLPAQLNWLLLPLLVLACVYFLAFSLGAFQRRRQGKVSRGLIRFAIIIPAHNEELLISDTVRGVFNQEYTRENYKVLVVADNCSDHTADKARAAGAQVLIREGNPGKGQALHAAFELLSDEGWQAYLVVDADTRLDRACLTVLEQDLDKGHRAVQLFYGVLNPGASWRTALMEAALASFNGLRPKSRSMLGLSAGLFGNGFCLSREVVARVPYLADSIVEDLQYHLSLIEAGYRVYFEDGAKVRAQMPTKAGDSTSQRVRWERGRLQVMGQFLKQSVLLLRKGRAPRIETLLEVMTPPMGFVLLITLFALIFGNPALSITAAATLLALAFHYGLAVIGFGHPGRFLRALPMVPWYLVWKCFILAKSIFIRPKRWVRTNRHTIR